MKPIVDHGIEQYLLELHNTHLTPDELQGRMERRAAQDNFPIVGPLVASLLGMLARLVQATRVLELGSGFGYSALFFGRALGASGSVTLTDTSTALLEEAESFLAQSACGCRFEFLDGDALELLSQLTGPYDIIFNDVDKEQYPVVPELVLPFLRPGGLLITDNALWNGDVIDPPDAAAQGVAQYNAQVYSRPELETVILPIRDGLAISRRTD